MARASNIKPGFFKNEELAECTPWARLCFIGLWTLADREGRLEDRPRRIQMELFPLEMVDVEPLLAELARHGFIRRYRHDHSHDEGSVNGRGLIQVVNFSKHQNPHCNEKASTLPSEDEALEVSQQQASCEPGAGTVQARCKDGAGTVLLGLIPDSGFLKPDPLTHLGNASGGVGGNGAQGQQGKCDEGIGEAGCRAREGRCTDAYPQPTAGQGAVAT